MSEPTENTNTIISSDQLNELTLTTTEIVKKYDSTTEAVNEELEAVTTAIETWEKNAPALYAMRKRLTLIQEILSGKRSVDKIVATDAKVDKPKTDKKRKKTFIKRKSDIITDEVVTKIRDFISETEEYRKSKDIYKYLRKKTSASSRARCRSRRRFHCGL